jgi:hypothetical protein
MYKLAPLLVHFHQWNVFLQCGSAHFDVVRLQFLLVVHIYAKYIHWPINIMKKTFKPINMESNELQHPKIYWIYIQFLIRHHKFTDFADWPHIDPAEPQIYRQTTRQTTNIQLVDINDSANQRLPSLNASQRPTRDVNSPICPEM